MAPPGSAHPPVLENLHAFYKELQGAGILFCYSGPTTQSLIEDIGELLKQRMAVESAGLATTRNLFSIFIEQMQNILQYSAEVTPERVDGEPFEEVRYGVVVIGREDSEEKRFFVMCGNYVETEKGRVLVDKIEGMRNLNREELKALYKAQRRRDPSTDDSKGAGLGFLEMARKATRSPDCRITEVDDRLSFFSLKVVG